MPARRSFGSPRLAICLTPRPRAEEARALAREMAVVKIPVVAVLGNHDFESSQQDHVRAILSDSGVVFLDGDSMEILGIGFAGTKGRSGSRRRGAEARIPVGARA